MSDSTAAPLPLSGIRVLEFCHTIMGPSAGVLLADLGADVIKIEPSPEGDRTRRLQGFAQGFFYAFNRNKRSFAVDLKSDEGRQLVHRLTKTADVVIENYAPDTMERLGCGYKDLAALNPRIIYCALKGFLSGPYENRPALDEIAQYMTGLAYMDRPDGTATSRRCIGGRHYGRYVRRHRHSGGVARTRDDRTGAEDQIRLVRGLRLFNDPAHGGRDRGRRKTAPDARPEGCLGGL